MPDDGASRAGRQAVEASRASAPRGNPADLIAQMIAEMIGDRADAMRVLGRATRLLVDARGAAGMPAGMPGFAPYEASGASGPGVNPTDLMLAQTIAEMLSDRADAMVALGRAASYITDAWGAAGHAATRPGFEPSWGTLTVDEAAATQDFSIGREASITAEEAALQLAAKPAGKPIQERAAQEPDWPFGADLTLAATPRLAAKPAPFEAAKPAAPDVDLAAKPPMSGPFERSVLEPSAGEPLFQSFASRVHLHAAGMMAEMPLAAKPPATSEVSPVIEREITRAEREAELRAHAVALSSLRSSPPSKHSSSSSVVSSPSKAAGLGPIRYFELDSIPDELRDSDCYLTIKQVLSAPWVGNAKDWRVRNFFELDAVQEHVRWLRADPAHLDSSAALTHLYEWVELCVPEALLSADLDERAWCWNEYRKSLISALDRAFNAGVSWRRILKELCRRYGKPDGSGHPQLLTFVSDALQDELLIKYPLLHADCLIYLCDVTFGSGSADFEMGSFGIDWKSCHYRQRGETVSSLARRVVRSYTNFVNNPKVTAVTVWDDQNHRDELHLRFACCLSSDTSDPARGQRNLKEYMLEWHHRHGAVQNGREGASYRDLSCIKIADERVEPYEQADHKMWRLTRLEDAKAAALEAGAPAPALMPPIDSQVAAAVGEQRVHRGGYGAHVKRQEARAQMFGRDQ